MPNFNFAELIFLGFKEEFADFFTMNISHNSSFSASF